MRTSNYFETECSTCGRKLQVRVEHLGKTVLCPQCHSEFVADDPIMSQKKSIQRISILERADQLLSLHDATGSSATTQNINSHS
jgi:predicted RNA-binding Zn-ribbon protein involved in translation (DUF1610 family)